jgi:hypothetical protein
MKTFKFAAISMMALWSATFINAQTADEIVSRYIDSIGGKDQISKINTLYTESSLDVMGNQGTSKITLVNGKGVKQDIDVQGTNVIMCWTDSSGWSINPMSGNYDAVIMPPTQYKSGRDEIFFAGPFLDYAQRGYKIELAGKDSIGQVNADKILVTSPDSVVTEYYFDPATALLIQKVQKTDMMGQIFEIVTNWSNYKATDSGIKIPHTIQTNYGGQFLLMANVIKVDVNQPVDSTVFKMPAP